MRVLLFCTLLLGLVACAYEKAFIIRDVTSRQWGPEVVSYAVTFPAPMKAAELGLCDEAGMALPVQFTDAEMTNDGRMTKATVSFLAAVPANGTARYLLRDVKPDMPLEGVVTVTKGKGFVELRNDAVALRLSPTGTLKAEKPVPAGELPGPFAGFRAPDGKWVGGSKLVTTRKVTSFTAKILAEGPVYAEAAYTYTFEPQGTYTIRIRLDQGAPMAFIDEEFDTPSFTDGRDYLAVTTGNGVPSPDDADQFVIPWKSGDFGKVATPGCTFTPIAPWDMFGERTYLDVDPALKLGMLVLHSGSWRHPHNAVARLRAVEGKANVLELPFSCYGVLRPWNPFDTAENDPSEPDTYGRRVWGLTLTEGTRQDQRLQYGFIGLDRYKDWVLDWPDPVGDRRVLPPTTYLNAAGVQTRKATLTQNPYVDSLKALYVITPADENGRASLKKALAGLDARLKEGVSQTGSSFRQAQYDNSIVPYADDALAWPGLSAEERATLRAKIAARCYLLADPDFNPRGLGDHLGNPNMPINRYMGFPQYIQLIPTHPMYQAWVKDAVAYVAWKLADNTSPYGAWREEQGYQQAAVPHITEALLSLQHAGKASDAMLEYAAAIHRYMLAVLSPVDRNDRDLRYCEGTGNGTRSRGDSMPFMATLIKEQDPELAGNLMWAWEEMGCYPGAHVALSSWLAYDPSITPMEPRDLPGAFLPGFGATSRANFGQPSETFLLFRQGHNQSHFDMDQGSFKMYAFGEQMIPNSSLGYNSPAPASTQHGTISFGNGKEWTNNHGRTDSMITDYAYLKTADYFCGRQRFDAKSGGADNAFVKEPFDWYRQFVVMKSQNPLNPTYFVLRDTFRGPEQYPTHWHCWLLGKPDGITVEGNRVVVKTPQGNVLELVFANMETIKPTFTYKATAGNSGCGFPPTGATLMQLDAPAGQEYLVVIYPRQADMKRPLVSSPAPGVVKVEAQDSLDWAFLSPDEPITYQEELVEFKGRCGAIHRTLDWGVTMALLSGGGEARCRNFRMSSFMPRELIKTREELEKGGTVQQTFQYEPFARKLDFRYSEKVEVQPGVTKYTVPGGFGYTFASQTPIEFNQDGVVFKGRLGALFVTADQFRLVMGRDYATGPLDYIGYKDFVIRGEGPYDLVFTPPNGDKGGEVTGVADGRARLLEMPLPRNLVPTACPQLAFSRNMIPAQNDGPILTGIAPTLYLNGKQWQVGYYDRGLALPLFEGKNDIRITRFYLPPIAPAVPRKAE